MAAKSGAYPFVFFAAMMVVQLIVVSAFYPETKGVSLEQMQAKLGNSIDSPSNSTANKTAERRA